MKHSKEGKWVFSINDEVFRTNDYFETKEHAIEAGKTDLTWEGKCPIFYIGQVESPHMPINIDVDGVLETIHQGVYDEVGEVAEDYLNDVKKEHYQELEDKLSDVILEWMKKFDYQPTFYKVVNIEKVMS